MNTSDRVKRYLWCAAIAVLSSALLSDAEAAITYVQSDSATPQTPQTGVSVAYSSSQAAGNLNIVVVGWPDSSASVQSVTDTRGNTYQVAAGPTTITGSARQSIYYSASIAAGTNTVTVSFSPAAAYPDVRILEYSGIAVSNPVDAVTTATGNGTNADSGSLTTLNANDLLVAATTIETWHTGPGTNFTQRILTSPNSDIVEDRVVTATGSYSATAPIGSAGYWIMQMVAFKAASGGSGVDCD